MQGTQALLEDKPFTGVSVHLWSPPPQRRGGVTMDGGLVGPSAGMWREAAALLTGVSEDPLGILTGRMESGPPALLPLLPFPTRRHLGQACARGPLPFPAAPLLLPSFLPAPSFLSSIAGSTSRPSVGGH